MITELAKRTSEKLFKEAREALEEADKAGTLPKKGGAPAIISNLRDQISTGIDNLGIDDPLPGNWWPSASEE